MDYSRNYVSPRIGGIRQLARIVRTELTDGKGKGMRAFFVSNGAGLNFTVYPDRGLDIGEAEYCGVPLVWQSANGPVNPRAYEPENFNWLRSWGGGLLTGCGLLNAGAPDDGEGLHGRLSHLPAEEVNTRAFWNEAGEYVLEISGTVRHARVFGEKLRVDRVISCVMGGSAVNVTDTVTNDGFTPVRFLQLYHMNFGWPLVDADAVIETAGHPVTPKDQIAATGMAEWQFFNDPVHGFAEQVFYHDIPAGADGLSTIALRSPNTGLRLLVSCSKAELPLLVQWKQHGEGEYVLGLEPGNCVPEGRSANLAKNLGRELAPGVAVTQQVRVALEKLS